MFGFIVSTADRMPTFGARCRSACARSIAFCTMSTLVIEVGRDIDRGVGDEQHLDRASARPCANTWLMRTRVLNPPSFLTTAASSSSEWIAPFITAFGFACHAPWRRRAPAAICGSERRRALMRKYRRRVLSPPPRCDPVADRGSARSGDLRREQSSAERIAVLRADDGGLERRQLRGERDQRAK